MDGFEKYVGLVFDNRYKIEKIIGIGGMAVVYKAIDLLMKRVVAVKMLKDEIAADEQSVKRFINESKAVAMLSHPNIVNIYDVSVRDNVKYIVMEYVEGITLKNYMTHKGILSLREIISYSEQILTALDHAHAKGIVHRDIKPHNIMLLKSGRIKVMDFGIAKLPNAETVTMTDKAIGTVYYISPEQASGGRIDARSDLYSLGIMMYEMATGTLPFNADSPVSVALMQVHDSAVPPRKINPQLPPGLEQIITKAMEKEPGERYQSAALMLRHLLRLKENPHVIFREVQKSARKKKRKPHRASHSMLPIIMGVVFAFLLVCGISGYYALDRLFFSNTTDKAETLPVEKFVDKPFSEQLQTWFDKSEYYTLLPIKYVYSSEHEEGTIIDQSPKAGERRKFIAGKQKCEIELTVSQGAQTVVMPDVLVYDYRVADRILSEEYKLKVSTQRIHSETFDVGTVIRTEPVAGTTLELGDKVTIYVSQGPAIGTVAVPNFVGGTEVQTLRKVIASGLRVGTVTYEKNDKPAGTVLSQDPISTKIVYANSTVNFVVSGGPDWVDPNAPETDVPLTPDNPVGTDPDDPATVDPDDPYAGWEPENGFEDAPVTEEETDEESSDFPYSPEPEETTGNSSSTIPDWLDRLLGRG